MPQLRTAFERRGADAVHREGAVQNLAEQFNRVARVEKREKMSATSRMSSAMRVGPSVQFRSSKVPQSPGGGGGNDYGSEERLAVSDWVSIAQPASACILDSFASSATNTSVSLVARLRRP